MQGIENIVSGLILAAGKGTRMGSTTPKVLCELAGKTLLGRVYDTLSHIGIKDICLVLGEDIKPFEPFLAQHQHATICIQHKRGGTGDAVAAAYGAYTSAKRTGYASGSLHSGAKIATPYTLICYGDTPCLSAEILEDFIVQAQSQKARLSLIGMMHPAPTGYGRIMLDKSNKLTEIIEEKDADAITKKVQLCNSGILLAEVSFLFELLALVDNKNSQGEYYLTDCFQICRSKGEDVFVYKTDQYRTFDGVNTKEQLASLNSWFIEHQSKGL